MDFDKKMCPIVDVDGFIEKGKQFDIEINLPEDNRNVIYGLIKDCYGEPVKDAVVKLIEVCGYDRKPVSHTFTDKEGEFVFGPLCPDKSYEVQIWANKVKHFKVCADCKHEGKCLKGVDMHNYKFDKCDKDWDGDCHKKEEHEHYEDEDKKDCHCKKDERKKDEWMKILWCKEEKEHDKDECKKEEHDKCECKKEDYDKCEHKKDECEKEEHDKCECKEKEHNKCECKEREKEHDKCECKKEEHDKCECKKDEREKDECKKDYYDERKENCKKYFYR